MSEYNKWKTFKYETYQDIEFSNFMDPGLVNITGVLITKENITKFRLETQNELIVAPLVYDPVTHPLGRPNMSFYIEPDDPTLGLGGIPIIKSIRKINNKLYEIEAEVNTNEKFKVSMVYSSAKFLINNPHWATRTLAGPYNTPGSMTFENTKRLVLFQKYLKESNLILHRI